MSRCSQSPHILNGLVMINPVTIALLQFSCEPDREKNISTAVEMSRTAAASGARLILLPELFSTRYFCQREDIDHFAFAESVPGPSSSLFEKLAKELDVSFVVSLFERRTAGLYHNTACVVDPKRGYLGKYRKLHIPDDPLYLEKYYFAPGDLGIQIFETQGLKVAVLICWDQWFPEAARMAALAGADLIVYPTAIGWHPSEKDSHGHAQQDAWTTIQRSHAIANGCFVASVNRTGFEPTEKNGGYPDGIQFWGSSFVAGPDGGVMAAANESDETIVYAQIDLSRILEQRHGWPFLRDRRVDQYQSLTGLLDD
jgi:N-carbamoylputrescine amidase